MSRCINSNAFTLTKWRCCFIHPFVKEGFMCVAKTQEICKKVKVLLHQEITHILRWHYEILTQGWSQIKFLRHLLGITKLDKEKNQCIRGKTGAQNIVKVIKWYQKKWLQHVQRMDRNRLPRQAMKYRPQGRQNVGWPKKRWRDQLHFED